MKLNITAQADDEAKLLIYDHIGTDWDGSGNDAKGLATELMNLQVKVLNIRINSPGGDLFAGHAIYSSIRQFKGIKRVYIDGLAASAASIIAMAGDEIIMPKNTMLMIHNASTYAWGDSQAMAKTAADLEKINTSLIAVYQQRTGLAEAEIRAMMNEETWLTADEAVAKGFATKVVEDIAVEALVHDNVLAINGVEFKGIALDKLKRGILNNLKMGISAGQSVQMPLNTADQTIFNKGNQAMTVITAEILQKEHLQVYDEIYAKAYDTGIKAERERIKAIEDMEIPGHKGIITKAKFETGASAETLAMAILKAEKEQRSAYLADTATDAAEINKVNTDGIDPANEINRDEQEYLAAIKKGANREPIK